MRKSTVLGLAALGLTAAALWPTSKVPKKGMDRPAQVVDQNLPLSVDQFDAQIGRIESGAAQCAEMIKAKLNGSSVDPGMYIPLTNPFEIASRNAVGNPLRNVQRQREAAAGLDSVVAPETHFFYEQLPGEAPYAAAYSPAHKTMKVPEGFFLSAEESDAVDCLVAGHEYRHVGQDIILRRGIDSDQEFQAYLKMRQETLIISDEVTAYAFELEHLDLLLDGDLSKNAGKMDFDEVAARLKTKYTANVSPLRTLLNMAPFYYIDYVSPLKALSPIFFEHVADLYRSMGAKTLLMNDGTGRLRPYRGVRPNR